MAITGPDKDTPMKVGPGIGDLMPATMCAVGIVSAILRAHKTGQGQFVDVGMVDAILSMCERIVQPAFLHRRRAGAGRQPPIPCFARSACSRPRTALSPSPPMPTRTGRSCGRLIGKAEMGTDPRLANVQDRRAHQAEIIAAISAFTSQRTKQELLKHLGGQGAVRAGQRRARRLRQSALRRPATWWCRCRTPASTTRPRWRASPSR